jgi:HK97 family phage prohead protease
VNAQPSWYLGETDEEIAGPVLQPPSLAYRGYGTGHYVIRSDQTDAAGEVMTGHLAVFNEWTEINSRAEGHFLERIAPGAFRKTIAESRNRIKTLFQHGRDPVVADKVLGSIEHLGEDEKGVAFKVRLFETASYVRDLLPGLRAGVYGSSFRGRVVKSDFQVRPPRSPHNPEGIPEQTIREFKLIEFGPVSFPQYEGATAGLRSMTDYFQPPITNDERPLEVPVPVLELVPEVKPDWYLPGEPAWHLS